MVFLSGGFTNSLGALRAVIFGEQGLAPARDTEPLVPPLLLPARLTTSWLFLHYFSSYKYLPATSTQF
jgi:hypothetical protein